MNLEIPQFSAEIAKILGGAIVGALCTAIYAKYVRVKKFVLHVDQLGGDVVGMPKTPFNFKVLLNETQYDSLNVFVFTIKNAGTDCVENFDIIISPKSKDVTSWFVECGLVNDAMHPTKTSHFDDPPFFRVNYDNLNPNESDRFVVVSKAPCDFNISCRKPNVRVINLKTRRSEIQSLAAKLLRITQPFGIS